MKDRSHDSSPISSIAGFTPMQLITFFAEEGDLATEATLKLFESGSISNCPAWQVRFLTLQLFYRVARGGQFRKLLELPFSKFLPENGHFHRVTGFVVNLPVKMNFENGGTYYFSPKGIESCTVFLELSPAPLVEDLQRFVKCGDSEFVGDTLIEDVGLFDVWSEEFRNITLVWGRDNVVINDPDECAILDVKPFNQ